METAIAAPEAPAAATETAQPTEQTAQTTTTETTQSETHVSDGPQVDRGGRLAEIESMIKADPDTKLNDEDLAIYEEGLSGKLKPKASESVEETKEVKAEKTPVKDDPIQKAMKELGAKSPDEIPAKISELRKAISGKDAQAVASLTKELEGFKAREAAFTGTTRFIEDLKSGNPKALEYLQKELGVKLPSQANPNEKPFTEEADLLTDGALSRAWEREQALIRRLEGLDSKFGAVEKANQESQTKAKVASQVVDEAWSVAQNLPGIKDLPNLRNRIMDFQAGKDDPDLAPLAEIFDYAVTQNKEKGLILDPETAYFAIKGRNMAAEIAAAEERGGKSAYNHKPNKSLSSLTTEEAKPETFTQSQIDSWGESAANIPDSWFDKDKNLVPDKIPPQYRKHFGY